MLDDDVRPMMSHRLRRQMGPTIDRVAKRFGQPEYRVWPKGYVATVSVPIAEVETKLHDEGFTWDPLSLYHYTLVGNKSDGSWTYRSSRLANRQLHVVLFERRRGRTDVYAHAEYSWLRHPLKHAEEKAIRRSDGAATMQRVLEAWDVDYTRESIVTRTVRHTLARLRDELLQRSGRS
ncbi:hypothetical protein [Haloterrigena salifodinae]|uniref:hypothetical protein n=1 Tax=Haloterrigena salifodinae TaxID=2675099 RepID=UPI000F85C348|nr:hypothetical protein [Haloterrigena salifodinae]